MQRDLAKDEVITMIQKMIELGQREQAARTYKLANETFPEWALKQAFEQLKEKQ